MKSLKPKAEERRTAKEWFNIFPEPYKSQALQYMEQYRPKELNNAFTSGGSALNSSINWGHSAQGHNYWSDFFQKLIRKEIILEEQALYEIF